MTTPTKIKIFDIPELREQLDCLFLAASQQEIAKWAIKLAKHILDNYALSFNKHETILKGFKVSEAWLQGKASMTNVRQTCFAIHKLAKSQEDKIACTALRTVGHCLACAHMKEHGMVASDYAIKCCNLALANDNKVVEIERLWQINELLKTLNNH